MHRIAIENEERRRLEVVELQRREVLKKTALPPERERVAPLDETAKVPGSICSGSDSRSGSSSRGTTSTS